MNGAPLKKKKNQQSYKSPAAQNIKNFKASTGKQQVDDIFPVYIEPSQVTPQLKQYIQDMEKEYLDLQTTLMSNRTKYEQMFGGLAALLDQRGISFQQMTAFINKSVYYPPQTD